jgi:hypothetical protein
MRSPLVACAIAHKEVVLPSWTPGIVGGLVVGLGLVAATSARAAECTEPYSSDQLVLDVQKLEEAVVDQDDATSIAAASRIQTNLPCVQQKLPLGFLGRVYRGLAGGFYVGGDTKTSESWYRTAIELDRNYRYGLEDLPSDNPLRTIYASMLQAEEDELVPLGGKAFGPKGDWFLDGRRLQGPIARAGRPHLLQLEVEDSVRTWLIDGAGFPAEILVDGKNVAENGKKRRKRDKTKFDVAVHEMGQGAVLVDRSRPPEQIPLIATGAGLIVTGIALYAGSAVSRSNFNDIRSSETDLRKSQQTTNRLALAALATAAIGAGSLTYGIVIDDAGNPIGGRIGGRF